MYNFYILLRQGEGERENLFAKLNKTKQQQLHNIQSQAVKESYAYQCWPHIRITCYVFQSYAEDGQLFVTFKVQRR